jgi:Tfp pilus assembly major pilin PilA
MDDEFYIIKMSRLLEYRHKDFYWNNKPVTLQDIDTAIENRVKGINEVYDDFDYLKDTPKTNTWHIARIIYFIQHPTSITPLNIDNKCYNGIISAIPIIEDGNHRFMALLYLKRKEIKINYSGRRDVLEYLQGKTNKIPE